MFSSSRRSRLGRALVVAAVAAGSLVVAGAPASASSAVTIKAKLGASFRLLAVTKSGKTFVAAPTRGAVTLRGISRAETSGMTLSVINTKGTYVGPVMLRYLAKKKATTSPKKATAGFIKMKRASKSTVDLGSIRTGANYAYATKAPAVTGKSVAVSRGVPPARQNFGKGSSVRSGGVRSMADPTENPLGDDADNDGIAAFADVDDDNDGKLDLVDDAFYQTPVKDDGSNQGQASIFTALVCGGECVNLNAFNATTPTGAAGDRLNKMINTFQGVFFQFRDVAKTFPTRANRDFGFFNIDCAGIEWCAGTASKAVTISPDFDATGNQPPGNALPLAAGENYTNLCGAGVIAKDPAAASNPGYQGPSNWPRNDAGSGSAFDRLMDEWVFRTCDPDGDSLPNIIPSKGTINSGEPWMNEIKPRLSGANGMKVGDTIRYNITNSSKRTVYSSTQVISGVIQTAPSVRTWNGTSLHNADGSYSIATIPAMTDAAANANNTATVTFWRPQRAPIGTESTWQDVGGLTYAVGSDAKKCTISAAVTSDGRSLTVRNGDKGSAVVDDASDATPNPANFIQVTITDIASCMPQVGQMSVSAMDKSGNSTHFKWQRGQAPQPGQPQNPPNPPTPG